MSDSNQYSYQAFARTKSPRRQIMLDQSVQGALIHRVTVYWFLCLASVVFASWIWNAFLRPGLTLQVWASEHLTSLVVPMLGSLVLLPLAWADMIRTSNRIVAPVHSVRTAIRRKLLGDDVPPLVCRPSDFWQDFTRQFNRLTASSPVECPSTESLQRDINNREADQVTLG